MDRPMVGNSIFKVDKSKEFVVPQYIIDSINNLFLLPTGAYLPGKPCPPHLSPFIDNVGEKYIPDRQREINTLAGVATEEVHDSDSSSEEEEVE